MDYDPAAPDHVRAQSLSPQLAITSLKAGDAPGSGSVAEDDEPKNIKMYVLETVAHPPAEKGLVDFWLASLACFNFHLIMPGPPLTMFIPSHR